MKCTVLQSSPVQVDTYKQDEWSNLATLYSMRYTYVYLCEYKKHPKYKGALKVYQKKTLVPQRIKFIQNEINIYSLLEHEKYIVPLWFHFETDHHIALMTKYMNQDTLAGYIYKYNTEYCIVHDVILPMLNILKMLKRRRIIHRDLKPENIFVHNHHVFLGDFGYACLLEGEEKGYHVIGTHQYMAPELLRCVLDSEREVVYGYEIDIWSLGIIAYELLFHRKPFGWSYYRNIGKTDPTQPEFIQRCLDAPLEFPHYISEDAKDFLGRVLCKEPAQRWTVEQLHEHPWILNHLNTKKLNEPCPLTRPLSSQIHYPVSEAKKKSKTPCAIS